MGQTRHDNVLHAVAGDGALRGICVTSTNMVEEARRRHDLWPTAAAATGRALSATAMLGAMLKGDDLVAVQVLGQGPLGRIHCEADAHGHVRGYAAHPHVHLELNREGKLDVSAAVGAGMLYVTRNTGLKEPYTGSVPLVSGELGQDFAYYFVHSEQTPSVVSLGVLVDTDFTIRAAGGFIIQALPGASDDLLEQVERYVQTLPPVSKIIDEGADAVGLMQVVLGPWTPTVLEMRSVSFQCSCSRERLTRALITLGNAEIEDMISNQGGAELTCHFCGNRYQFTEADLQEILDTMQNPLH